MRCTCHDREIDHAFDDDIDQYVVPGRQNSPQEATERPQETRSGTGGIGGGLDVAYVAVHVRCELCADDADRTRQKEQELRAYLSADRYEGDQ